MSERLAEWIVEHRAVLHVTMRLLHWLNVLTPPYRNRRTFPWDQFVRMTPEQRDRFLRETGIAERIERSMAEVDARRG